MSRSLHIDHFPGKYIHGSCDLNEVDDPGLAVPCRVRLEAHPAGICTDRPGGHPVAVGRGRGGVRVTRKRPTGYARTWYRGRMTELERGRTRSNRRVARAVLGQLTGAVEDVLERVDDALERRPGVTGGPQRDVSHDAV